MAVPNEPITREERYLSKMAGQNTNLPESPITRKEFFLAKAAGQDVDTPNPTTRIEMYLDVIAQGGGGGSAVLVDKTITANGEYDPADDNADGYSGVTVNVSGGAATLVTKSIAANGTYNASSDSADGYSSVTVNVPNTYAAGDEGKVVSNGALVSQTSETYTANGTYDTTTKNSVTVNVPSGGSTLTTKTITANGTYAASSDNADGYSSVTVNVSGGGGDDSFAKVVDRSITTANIPEGVTSVGMYAFAFCSSLASVNLPSTLTHIYEGAFQQCALTDITVPYGVTSIGGSAFLGCPLTNVDLPSTITSIGTKAFYAITSGTIKNFTVRATTPPTLGTTAISLDTRKGKIYVPAESVDAYKAATNWSNYASQIYAIT